MYMYEQTIVDGAAAAPAYAQDYNVNIRQVTVEQCKALCAMCLLGDVIHNMVGCAFWVTSFTTWLNASAE